MGTWDIKVEANATFHTTVEAESVDEAYRKATQAWMDCEMNEIEFDYPTINIEER